jgi:SAM-dependent methyltransferase
VFKDHFSAQAASYERHRPGYPAALFAYLAGLAPARCRALDVATGNGQAAVGLAEFFDAVLATEPSGAQLALARAHPRVSYRQEPAERIGAPDGAFDLLAAAQAAHWFDWARFPAEASRVLKPGGILALWTYELCRAGDGVDALVADFYRNVTGPYWPRERRHVEEHYASLPFPFAELPAPAFALETRWSVDDMLGYLATWSSVQRYRKLRGDDPVALVEPLLRSAWGTGERQLSWPIHLRVGRKPG